MPCVFLREGKDKCKGHTKPPPSREDHIPCGLSWHGGEGAWSGRLWSPPARIAHCALPLSGNLRKLALVGGGFLPSFCEPDRGGGQLRVEHRAPPCDWHHSMPAILNGDSPEACYRLALRKMGSCRSWWEPHLLQPPRATLWYLWPRPEGIAGDGPWHRRPPPQHTPPWQGASTGGSRWLCTFLKHLFCEKINCRLTTQKRPLWTFWCIACPPPPFTNSGFLFKLNWEHTTYTILHLAFFT